MRANEEAFRSSLRTLEDLPIVGDVRGDGYFFGVELVKDKATKGTFNDEETERLLRGFLSPALFDAGLVCRADDRGDPVVQFAPPAHMRAGALRHHRRRCCATCSAGPRLLSEPPDLGLTSGG